MLSIKTGSPAESAATTRRNRMHKQLFLTLFASSFIFLVLSYFPDTVPDLILISLLLVGVILIAKVLGKKPALAFGASAAIYFLLGGVEYISTLYLHMSFLCFALYFLWPERQKLISGCGSTPKRIGYGILIFGIMLIAAIIANLLIHAAGITDQDKVVGIVSALPIYVIIMAFTLGPISEELFFRAFLVPRVGVPVSTIMFALVHAAYGSIAELAGALFLGFVLANAYYFLRDPLPCIIAHALFNLLSISLILWVY